LREAIWHPNRFLSAPGQICSHSADGRFRQGTFVSMLLTIVGNCHIVELMAGRSPSIRLSLTSGGELRIMAHQYPQDAVHSFINASKSALQ
jgi:hypothetical protein